MAETNQIVYEIITRGGPKLSSEIHAIENNLEHLGHILSHTFDEFGKKANYSIKYIDEVKKRFGILPGPRTKGGLPWRLGIYEAINKKAMSSGFTSYFSGPMTRKNEQAQIDLAKRLHSIRNQSRSELAQTLLRKTFPSQLLLPYDIGAGFSMGSDTTPLTRSMQSWHDIAETVRAKNRQQDASRKELARKLLAKAFPSQLLLPYNPNAELLPRNQIEKDGLANRMGMQALARARLRAKLGENWETTGVSNVNPRNPNSPYSRVSRLDKWSDSAYEHIKSLVPKGSARDIIGRVQDLGTIGKIIGLFCAGVLASTAALAVLKKVVSMLFDPFRKLAQEAFRFYRTRHMNSVSSGELTRAGIAGMIAGGNPDEMYALLTRITSQRAALRWGMGGGAFMEVARRFGVDISGSGPGGLATNTEWLRNIAIRMRELEPEDRIALANTAGLSREQMWLVSNGVKYFDWAMSKRTEAQQRWGWLTGSGVYSDNFQTESQNFHTDWTDFITTMTEFFGSVGEIILPILNMILEVLTMIFSAINLVLKPLAFVVGKIFSLLNLSYWENKSTMDDAAPKYNSSDYGGMVDVHGATPGIVNVNNVSINVQSNSADPTEVSEKVSEAFADNLAETWYRHNGHGLEMVVV